MLRHSLIVGIDDLETVDGAIICRDVTLPVAKTPTTVRRGTVVDSTLRASLARFRGLRVDVLTPEPGDIQQPIASGRLANALVGTGTRADEPHQGQVLVQARADGLLRVRGATVIEVNALGGFLVASSLDGRVVRGNETIAVIKASRLWLPSDEIDRAIAVCAGLPVFRVVDFAIRQAAFVVGPRVRSGNVRGATESLSRTLASYGTDLVETVRVTEEPADIARSFADLAGRGVGILLVAGSIVLDPGDPFLVALESLGARIVLRGAPIDPGTMFWVAYLGETVILGLASCEMYGRLSVLDLVLPYALAQEPIDVRLLAELGYGGMLNQTFTARRHSPVSDKPVDDGS